MRTRFWRGARESKSHHNRTLGGDPWFTNPFFGNPVKLGKHRPPHRNWEVDDVPPRGARVRTTAKRSHPASQRPWPDPMAHLPDQLRSTPRKGAYRESPIIPITISVPVTTRPLPRSP